MKSSLKLGTRRSLLAWAQSSGIARALEAAHPGLTVEMVGIDTQGDKILDKPLSQIDGKEFFTAELDLALLRGDVDFSVHSMKDLALDRPEKIAFAAAPKRELPHDVIVFHETVLDRLKAGKEIRIGTSSPRRLTLLPSFLQEALPYFSNKPASVRFVEIRGNVNTRISRIHEPENTEKKLDGVVLAFAGLERLALDSKASLELWKLFENTRLMILPLRECPTAPAQGALAIEARKDDAEMLQRLQALHDQRTLAAVQKERVILKEWGGGCHLKLGATFIENDHSSFLIIRGEKPNGENVQEIRSISAANLHTLKNEFTRIEASDVFDFKPHPLSSEQKKLLKETPFLFISHSRAAEFTSPENFNTKRIWVSGTKSWFKLAQKGIWIEGCLEGHGLETFQHFKKKKLLRLETTRIVSLTHAESPETAEVSHISTYHHEFREIPASIRDARQIFWASGLTFETVWSKLGTPESKKEFLEKNHGCGPGKTAQVLKANGIQPQIFTE